MEKLTKEKTDLYDSVLVAFLLALIGGFLDAYTYVVRGGVFATMQTGNMILLVIKGMKYNWALTWNYVLPILSFAIGAVISELLRDLLTKRKMKISWQQILLAIEMCILIVVIFIPDGSGNILATCLISIVAALQMNGFNKMKGHTFFSTMCTGNLSSGSVFLYKGIRKKDVQYLIKSLRYLGVIIFFILGAFLGSLIFQYTKALSLLLPCGVLGICFTILFFDKREIEVFPS